jgi:hypothetical protein
VNVVSAIELARVKDAHLCFILDTYQRSLAGTEEKSYVLISADKLKARLQFEARGKIEQSVVAYPAGHPDDLLGWASANKGRLEFAYVVRSFRRLGICSEMLARVLPDGHPYQLVNWTKSAELIRRAGFPVVWDCDTHYKRRLWR